MLKKLRSLNSILFVAFLFLFCSCSFLNNNPSFGLCPVLKYTRTETKAVLDKELGLSSSVFFNISEVSKTTKASIICFLVAEYESTYNRKDVKIVTFYTQPTGAVVQYVFDFEESSLLEIQFAQKSDTKYVITFSTIIPLNNIMFNFKVLHKSRISIVADHKVGVISKDNFLKLMAESTNGLFPKQK